MPAFSIEPAALLPFAFALIGLLYVITSAIFVYHWYEYAVNRQVRTLSLTVYFAATLPLVALMGAIVLFT